MSAKRRILQNSFWNFLASVGQKLGQVVILIIIARSLNAAQSGVYSLANTYTSILLAISIWGIDQILIRDVAKDRDLLVSYFGKFASLRLTLAIVLWSILAIVMLFLPYEDEHKIFIMVMALSIIPVGASNLYQSVWVALEDVKLISIIFILFSLIRIVGGAIIIITRNPLIQIAYLFVILGIIELMIISWRTNRRVHIPMLSFNFDFDFWVTNLKVATPLIIVTFILLIEYQFDVVILSLFHSETEVGIYSTAATVFTLLLFLTRSFQLAIFPVISRAYNESHIYLKKIYKQALKFLLGCALLISIGITMFSNQIIFLIYGEGYERAAPMLAILVWAFFISAFNVPNSRVIIAGNHQKMIAYFAILSMVGNLTLSFMLVPIYGGVGTAWARVLAMPLFSIPAFLFVQSKIFSVSWRKSIIKLLAITNDKLT